MDVAYLNAAVSAPTAGPAHLLSPDLTWRRGWSRTVASPGTGRSGRAPAGRCAAPPLEASGGAGAHHSRDDRCRVQVRPGRRGQVLGPAYRPAHIAGAHPRRLRPGLPRPSPAPGPPPRHPGTTSTAAGPAHRCRNRDRLACPGRSRRPTHTGRRRAPEDRPDETGRSTPAAPRNASDRSLKPGTLSRHATSPVRTS